MTYQIGEVTRRLGLSADTLRYYEKIGLLPTVTRTLSGLRSYSEKDISRLRFIKRAQRMNFSLAEIGQLLGFRENPQTAKPHVQQLAYDKLQDVEQHLQELNTLRDELTLLVNLCTNSNDNCPILTNLDGVDIKKQGRRDTKK
jgi:MerR family transcriptional regulator, copper efflux regulator